MLRPGTYPLRAPAAQRAVPRSSPRWPGLRLARPATAPEGSEREHAADQGPPGHRADDAVDGNPERLLEGAHRGSGLGPEDPVDRQALARIAGQVTELEFLLDAAHRVTR